ncbi:MAG: polysaccharide biosynthesis tyrosine autokinase [Pseudomonadota bacterium]
MNIGHGIRSNGKDNMTENRRLTNFQVKPVPSPERFAEDDDTLEIDLRAILAKLWHGKWIIVICTLFAGTFGLLTSSQIDPVYRASAKVMFDLDESSIVDVGQLVGTTAGNDALQNQIEVLRSNTLVEKVVVELGLQNNPEFNPRLVEREVTLGERIRQVFKIPPAAREFAQNVGLIDPPLPPNPPPSPEEIEALERRIVAQNVLARLSLQPVPSSQVIEISFLSESPRTASNVANAFADQYIVDQLDSRLEATRAATDWLAGRVEELRIRLQTAEEAVESARATQSLEAGQSIEITQQQLQALNATLSVVRNEARTAQATFERLKSAVETGSDFGSVPEFRNSPLINQYRQEEIEIRTRRAARIELRGEDHPSVTPIELELTLLLDNMSKEAQRIVEAAQEEWLSLQAERQQIEQDVRELETKALEQSRDLVTVRQLEREAEASRILYENFLARLNETSEQERLTSADARVLTPAQPPLFAQTEAQNRTVLLSLFAGILAGVGLIFLLEKLNNTFRTSQQLEQMTGKTLLGSIPSVGSRIRRTTVVRRFKEKPKSGLSEAIRNLRTSILFSNVDKPPRVVMFTSSVPREGKSTTATLVAMTSRQMGKSAIIVDCDLRLPALADLLTGDDGKPGLLSAINGTAALDDCIFRDDDTGLHVLMTKPAEPRSNVNAADLLSSRRFDEMIDLLKSHYDLVILDTPPTLVVADAKILSSHADAVVYAVRWDHTPRGAVLEGLKELRTIKAPVAGVVLTMVNEAKASRYSNSGYGYYRARYKNYYVS